MDEEGKKEIVKKIEDVYLAKDEAIQKGAIILTTPENRSLELFHLKEFVNNYRDYYVFEKEYRDGEDLVSVTYYKYSFDETESEDEDGEKHPDIQLHSDFFMEEEWVDENGGGIKYTIYANNGCERGCCPTWMVVEYIDELKGYKRETVLPF